MVTNNSINLSEAGITSYNGSGIFHGRTLTSTSSNLTITNGSGIAGNPTFALSATLQGIGSLNGTGYIVQTGPGTFAERTFIAGSGISLMNPDGVAGATTITAGSTTPLLFHTDSGDATPAANAITFAGTAAQGISSSGAGSTVTYTIANATSTQKGVSSYNATNFTVTAGNVVSNAFTLTAGTGLTGGGSINLGGSGTISLSVPVSVANGGTGDTTLTLNGVLFGNGTSAVGITAQGASNTVLLGNGGVPSFGAVPNAALQNSSITLANGTNISVSGSPVSLGGTATINVAGPITPTTYTSNGVLYGNGASALQVTAQGASNTVLLGNGGIPSFGAVPNAALQNSSITFVAGTNITLSPSSPASVALGGSLTISATSGGSIGGANTVVLYDDFFGSPIPTSSTSNYLSDLAWFTTFNSPGGAGGGFVPSVLNETNPGVLQCSANGTNILVGVYQPCSLQIGAGAITLDWIVLPATGNVSHPLKFFVGLCQPGVQTQVAGGIYFFQNFSTNSGNYQAICQINSGTQTIINTSVGIGGGVGGFDKLSISINAVGTSVTFSINGVSVGTTSTNIPNSGQSLFLIAYMAGTTPNGENHIFDIDMVNFAQTLTTSR